MKKSFLITLLAINIAMVNAQPSITISGGIKSIGTENRTMTLWYIDESPSRDNIYKDISPIGNMAYHLNVRLQDNDPNKKLLLFGEGQGYVGSISGLAINGGFIYCGNNQGKVKIQPELSAVLGYCTKGVGIIENNDVYIQVNETVFQDYTDVSVSLRNAYIGIKPGISFAFDTGANSEIGFGVNYQISIKAGFVSFSGTGQDGNSASDFETLTQKNVGFYVDGSKSDKNPYNPDGLEFRVFYRF